MMARCCAKDPATGKRCRGHGKGTWCREHQQLVDLGRSKAAARLVEPAPLPPVHLRPLEGLSRAGGMPALSEIRAEIATG